MDIFVRNVDEKIVLSLDQKAEEIATRTGQKFSRNDYIKMLLCRESERELIEYKKDKFDMLAADIQRAMDRQAEMLGVFTETTARLITMVIDELELQFGEGALEDV